MITLGFDGSYIALNQDGLTDSRLTSAISQAVRDGLVTPDGYACLVILAEDNRRAVIDISLTANQDDINRAKARARVPAAITEGDFTPVIITSRLDQTQSAQAETRGQPSRSPAGNPGLLPPPVRGDGAAVGNGPRNLSLYRIGGGIRLRRHRFSDGLLTAPFG